MKRPTLVCLNNGVEPPTITRYVPKNTGGFFSETFEIVDAEQCARVLSVETMERFRLGQMRDQAVLEELVEQEPECA